MNNLVVKRYRLFAAICFIYICFIGVGATEAATGDVDISVTYNAKFAPILSLPKIPDGFSITRDPIYLLELNYIERLWLVETSYNSDYIKLTLFAGPYRLYNPIYINRDIYTKYIADKVYVESWINEVAKYSGTQGKTEGDDGIEFTWNKLKLPKPVESIIGEGGPRINVSGSRKISFSGRSQWDDLPETGTFKQSKFPSLHMEQTSRFKIKGQIGSKITIEVDQDSNRDVDIANTLKLRYKGGEDEIIQSIEAGNTNLSLPNSQFIGFSQNVQGLFGIKATAKIGNVDLTVITSQEKGSNEKSTFNAGAQASADTIWDYQYLHNVYFHLAVPSNATLTNVKLYTNDIEQNKYGLACVDPRGAGGSNGGIDTLFYVTQAEQDRNEVESRYFKLMEQGNDYTLLNQGKYVILNHSLGDEDVLAAYIEYTIDGQLRQEGKITGDTLVLKLIRDPNADPDFTTWDYEWKNVYDLRTNNISPEGFQLDIYKGHGGQVNDPPDQNGQLYIQIFGFDNYDNSNPNLPPDGLFDFNTSAIARIDAGLGHLIFAELEPFISPALDDPNPAIYDYRYRNTTRMDNQKYYIAVQTSKRASSFSLGKTNIIEGSEVVKMGDGTILKRGVDYNIVYEIGQITFLNQDALSTAADVSVDFEYSPFFMPEKKSLFGLAAEYKINENSAFSISGMYRKESTKEYRPRVGREPKRWFIWDSNLILKFEPQFLTSAVDALPLVETDAKSAIEFSGELAQNIPNPNLKNIAFIDDFEGSREATDLVMRRGVWTQSSPPVGLNAHDVLNRRDLWWYNPWDPIQILDIWPDKEVESHENQQDVLFLEYFPDSTFGEDVEGWAGVMRPMYAGLADQSRTKFIEIWYYPDENADYHPTLYIDAGNISEDIDADLFNDTEDKNGDGVFQSDEDTGLDGWTNEEEQDFLSMPGVEDPSGDDWFYEHASRYDYSRINGTQGNKQDPDRFNRIDKEDINNNGTLDQSNSYFEYAIDLNSEEYVAETTSKGWKLLRIPFQDSTAYTSVGNPDYVNINYFRVWMSGVSKHYLLKLATMELVGNKWQEISSPDPQYMNGIPITPNFEITVKNSQEHANSYESPPGVAGEYDRETGIQEKEQSLVLKYDNLYPGQRIGAIWTLLKSEDYSLYNRLRMFVHGNEDLSEDQPVDFFFRMGTDSSDNYYEYRTKLYPGWDERNYVDINFTELTGLKAIWQAQHDSIATKADIRSGKYYVRGNPSLTAIRMFIAGIEYDSLMYDTTFISGDSVVIDTSQTPLVPLNGEVWCDELVLSDIRKESDFAGRFSTRIGFADLMDFTLNFSRTGADFYKLNDTRPPGYSQTQKSVSGKINLHKFAPPSWGLSLPVSANWQNSLQLPRLKTGSDIVLPEELKEGEKTTSTNWSVTVSESFRKNTKNWLFNWTLNRIQTRYVYSKRSSSSPTQPINNSTSYESSGSYDLSPRGKPSFKPFFWAKYMLLPKSIHGIQMFYLPTMVKYDGSIKGTKSYSLDNRGNTRSAYTKDFTGNQNYSISLFSALKTDFSATTNRDISDPDRFKLSINPTKIKLGREKTYSQKFNINFSPKISRQLSPRITYSAKYDDNSDIARNPDSTRTSNLNSSIRGDITIDIFEITGLKKLLGSSGGGQQKNRFVQNEPLGGKVDRDRQREREEREKEEKGEGSLFGDDEEKGKTEEPAEEEGKEEEQGKGLSIPNPLIGLKKAFSVLTVVKPLKTTASTDKRLDRAGLYSRPGWAYTLGFQDDPDVERKDTTTYTRDQITRTLDYSFQSGLTPFRNLDLTTSYKTRISTSRSSSSTEPTETKGTEFPRVDGNLNGLEKLPLFSRFAQTMTLQSNYTQKVDETGNPDTDAVNSRTNSSMFSPLAGVNITLKNNVKVTIRYEQTKKKSEDLREEGSNRTDHDTSKGIKLSVSYSLTAPQGIKLPIFGRVKFSSQLTMSLDIDKRFTKSWFFDGEGEKTTDSDTDEISIEPRLTYRFSAKVTGGLNAKWSDSNDKIQERKRHVRELGIWTELRF